MNSYSLANAARYAVYPTLQIVEQKPEVVEFYFRNADASVANALRRAIISEVPTLAIDVVSIRENTTKYPDEFLVHRLGLIPLESSVVRDMVYRSECPCADYCQNCVHKYALDVATGTEQYTITEKDIQPLANAPPVRYYDTSLATHSESAIPIGKIPPGSKFACEMQAVKGIGKIHTKWSSVATATYVNVSYITVNAAMQRSVPNSAKLHIMKITPKGLFKLIESATQLEVDVHSVNESELDASATNFDLCVDDPNKNSFSKDLDYFLKKQELQAYISMQLSTSDFYFTVEAVGQLEALEIVKSALDALLARCETCQKSFRNQPSTIGVLGMSSTQKVALN